MKKNGCWLIEFKLAKGKIEVVMNQTTESVINL
jgi:hypothetical protein